jgi:hypothetical protein
MVIHVAFGEPAVYVQSIGISGGTVALGFVPENTTVKLISVVSVTSINTTPVVALVATKICLAKFCGSLDTQLPAVAGDSQNICPAVIVNPARVILPR